MLMKDFIFAKETKLNRYEEGIEFITFGSYRIYCMLG